MGDLRLGNHDYFLVRGAHGEIINSWIEEDASPTAVQTAEGAPDAANVPVAATEYTNFQGSIGLPERSLAPGDFSRMFLSDWDGTRPGQVTAWVRWPGDTAALVGGSGAPVIAGATDPINRAFALIEDPAAPGFVCQDSVYAWNGTQFTCVLVAPNTHPLYGGQAGAPPLFTSQYMAPPPQIVYATSQGVWVWSDGTPFAGLSSIGGWVNAGSGATLGAGAAPGGLSVPFYDFLAVLSLARTASDVSIMAYRPAGPAGSAVQTARLPSGTPTNIYDAALSTAPAIGSLFGARGVAGAVASEGVLWVATERAVWGVVWNDSLNTWDTEKLFAVPRVTGAPVEWRSEVYIPCEGQLAHIIPGQKGNDWIKADQFDAMPPPYNGWIVQCVATPDALYCKVVERQDAGTGTTRAAILRLDPSGAWSCVDTDVTATTLMGQLPLVTAIGGATPPAIGYFVDATHVRLLPVQSAGRNPRTMLVTQRPQAVTGSGITPFETGVARSNQKQILRYRLEIEDAVGRSVEVWYQLPRDRYPGVSDTFTSGAAAGTGTWTCAGRWSAGMLGYSGQIDANGNGWVWVEFDGQTVYDGGVGILDRYPDYTAVSWLLRINGDPTGTHVPTIRSFRTDREEYISKAKVLTARIDLAAGIRRRGTHDDDAGATDTTRDAAWVQSELAYIESMVTGKRAQTLVTPKGTTYQVELTKWQEVLVSMDDTGVGAATVQLSMKVLPLQGVL